VNETISILILAVVQGITEFLPVSSSAHLAILSPLFGLGEDSAQVAVTLHAGTLLAILIFYRRELLGLLQPEKRRLIPLLIIGTIPVGVIGVVLKSIDLFDRIFANLLVSGTGLLITGALLYFFTRTPAPGVQLREISLKQTILVGLAQALAILPGISRSGSTIATGIKVGVNREDAATFSFLLGIPAIAGAAGVELLSALLSHKLKLGTSHYWSLGLGFAASALVGCFALKILLVTLQKEKLKYFAWYCFLLGMVILGWQLLGR